MKAGVIGLGAMGAGMAANLNNAGYLHRVWNRTTDKARKFSEQTGVTVADSIDSLAADCDLIITCVSRDSDVLEVIGNIASSAAAGAVVVDTSTVASDTATRASNLLQEKQIHFLDCPVSGGVEGANKGTLSMMVGGDESILENVRETLSAIAGNIVYIGHSGSGQACKAVNQVLCAGINQAVTEGLAFGENIGLDMERVLDVVTRGAAGNWFMENRGRTMLAGSYDVGFKVNLHHKDLEICRKMAGQQPGTKIPLVEQTIFDYEILMEQGYGDEDISSLYRLRRKQ